LFSGNISLNNWIVARIIKHTVFQIIVISFLILNGCQKPDFEKENPILGKWEPHYYNNKSYKPDYHLEFLRDGTFRNYSYTLNKVVNVVSYEIDDSRIYINKGEEIGVQEYEYSFLKKNRELTLKQVSSGHLISIAAPAAIWYKRIK
jgi:hypothetical protein